MSDLITAQRAQQNSTLATLGGTNSAYLDSIITAASDSIRTYCRRDFTLTSYSEYRSGGVYPEANPLRLRQYPVTSISRIAVAGQAILVQNSDTATNQRAAVATTADTVNVGSTLALVLTRVASAVSTVNTLTVASYATLTAMATAIGAVGNGWTATVQSGSYGSYGLYPAADLKPLQGAIDARSSGVYLEIYTDIGSGMNGSWCGSNWGANYGWRLDDVTGEVYGRLPRGSLNLRIDYTAGFATIPQPVQEACVQLCQDLYQAGQVNSNLQQAKLGAYSYQLKSTETASQMSGKVMQLLAPYRDVSRAVDDE